MNCGSAQPLAQSGSCALPPSKLARWGICRLLWTAVASPPLGSGQGTLLQAHCLLVRTNALWRIAKARTEEPVEVRNIGKASPQGDVANAGITFAQRCKEHEGMFQPQLGDVCRKRCPRRL